MVNYKMILNNFFIQKIQILCWIYNIQSVYWVAIEGSPPPLFRDLMIYPRKLIAVNLYKFTYYLLYNFTIFKQLFQFAYLKKEENLNFKKIWNKFQKLDKLSFTWPTLLELVCHIIIVLIQIYLHDLCN